MSGSALVVVLLSLSVLVTGALAWETMASARRARATAEGVLRDYARVTAVQFVREAEARLDTRIGSGIDGARHALQRHTGSGAGDGCQCPAPPSSTLFLVSRTDLTVSAGTLDPSLVDELRQDLDVPPGPQRLRLRLRVHPVHGLVVTHVEGPAVSPVIVGFVAPETFLTEALTRVFDEAALLPGTLAGVESNRRLGVRVTDAAGRERFTLGPPPSPFTGRADFSPRFASLHVEATIPPALAPSLVIGGLPSSPSPYGIGLLLVSAALAIAAALQLRREIRFVRARADFVSSVSHELRTPLAQIRLFGETLVLGRVRSREEERRAAAVIVQEAQRLSQMVDNILLFSRAGREALPIRREAIDPRPLATEIVDGFRPQAASKAMAIALTIDDSIGAVALDPDAVRQILLNLLDNAVKYGPRGQTIRVDVRAEGGGLTLSVEDEGPGIAPADRTRIWEPFWRASGSSEGGTGLGLAIVRELVARHGGRASVEAGASSGARFVVLLNAPA